MAGAPDESGPGSAAGEQLQQQHVACQVFPERLAQGNPQQGFLSSFFTNNQKCQLMLLKTLQTNPYVKLLLDAMKHSGCAVRNISKEVAQKAVDEVFESCFNDHEPFGRIPHNKTYARYAHRDFQNRDRYYSNI